ncbi:MAG: Gfo/Idh/MocA family oxidoreductase [Armatimonadota bacterium]|nr:Gfo/Idh/MocA family oxidoreductase [Armatimonadota bacterium]
MQSKKDSDISRREFLGKSIAGLAAAGIPAWLAKSAEASENEFLGKPVAPKVKKFGPNDTIQVGVIGPGGHRGGYRQGLHDGHAIAAQQGCKIIAACDVDSVHLAEACQEYGPDCKGYKDFREVLGRKDIDAVVIGAPDHWHAVMCIMAMKAGKDVYCEKPLTLTIEEGRKITKVWKETKRVFQTGSQQRSRDIFRQACEIARNGRIGRIKLVETHLPTGPTGGPFEVTAPPADFNWDMWLGPARWTDYVKERTHGSFRWWLEYSGGMMTDWGAHHNDIAQWGLGMERSGPIYIEAKGTAASPCENSYNTFPEFEIRYTYADGTPLVCTNKGPNGVKFIGEEGWVFVDRGHIEASDQKILDEPLPANAIRLYESNNHARNFVECMRSRKQPICDAEIGHRSASVCHLGNISLRLNGRKLHWNPEAERFIGDDEANLFVSRPMRGPWKI